MSGEVQVVQKEGATEVPAQLLAQSIKKIADGFESVLKSGLTKRALVALIKDAHPSLNKSDIELTLKALDQLKDLYLTPAARK